MKAFSNFGILLKSILVLWSTLLHEFLSVLLVEDGRYQDVCIYCIGIFEFHRNLNP